MNLIKPTVGVDPGPDWATNLDADLDIVDSHNHTPGQGVQITPAAININTDLPANNNNVTLVRAVRYQPQIAAPSLPADLAETTVIGVDLYYIDGSGNLIRLTQSGAPAGATGTITGLPSGTASASFAGTTFTFQSATNTPASFNFGPVKISQPVVNGKGVTIAPNVAQALDYNLFLPVALPATQSAFVSDSAGNESFFALNSGVYTPTISGLVNVTINASGQAFFTRIGTNVIVHGFLTLTPTSPGGVIFLLSLPVASTLSFQGSLVGLVAGPALFSTNSQAQVYADTATNQAHVFFNAQNTGTDLCFYTFQYQIV